MSLFDQLFACPAVDRIFADAATVQRMLDFEAALIRSEARADVIPASAVEPVTSMCDAKLFDLGALSESAARAGNLAIPLIKELTAKVAASDRNAAGFVHWGATSQDVIDTAIVLQLRDAIGLIEADLAHIRTLLCDLAIRYRATPMAGRTWMQQAVPIVLGLKFAGWADALERHAIRLSRSREQVSVLQFGGAAGTLASLKDQGLNVARVLADELSLKLPTMPWHAHRDRFADVATTLGLLSGTLGKIGRDLSILSQTEVSEVLEPEGVGRGASSTMPQKRNPLTAAVLLAAVTRVPALVSTMLTAMVQENERGLGGWHAEWETLPQIVRLTAGALYHLRAAVADLEICPDRMQKNLDSTCGLLFAEAATIALAPFIGKSQANAVVESCAREALSGRKHLREVLQQNEIISTHLAIADVERLFDSLAYLGAADEFINRVVSANQSTFEEVVKT